jgi:hypothetical protein
LRGGRQRVFASCHSLDKLPSVIDTLITAIRNGELDQQLAEASKPAKAQGQARCVRLRGAWLYAAPLN